MHPGRLMGSPAPQSPFALATALDQSSAIWVLAALPYGVEEPRPRLSACYSPPPLHIPPHCSALPCFHVAQVPWAPSRTVRRSTPQYAASSAARNRGQSLAAGMLAVMLPASFTERHGFCLFQLSLLSVLDRHATTAGCPPHNQLRPCSFLGCRAKSTVVPSAHKSTSPPCPSIWSPSTGGGGRNAYQASPLHHSSRPGSRFYIQ